MAVLFAEATEQERILITEPISRAGVDLLCRELPQARIDERFGLAPTQLRALIGEYNVLIVRSETRVTDELLSAALRLKVIGRAGSGIDNIDLDAAFRRRVLVVHAPRGNVVAVAEHTVALLLALMRHLPAATASLKAGRWEKRHFVGVELANKTLGILGLGKIGREVARLAQVFAMQILAADPVVSAEQARRVGVTLLGKEEVLRRADIVTLHAAPASDMHMIRPILGAQELALLKPGAFLVNCARGGLLDEAALLEALERGRLAGVALDVFSQEPIGDDALGEPRRIPVDAGFKIRLDALRDAVERDRAEGVLPFCVAASAGTVNTGAVDPLDDLADFCREQGLWLHVDGAYGAFGILDPQVSPLFSGIARADSVALDLHKWLATPIECSCAIVRVGDLLRETFSLVPPYLRTEPGKGFGGGLPWFSEYGFQQTRRFNALKLLWVIQQAGRAGLIAHVSRHNTLAQYMASLIDAAPDLERMAPVELSIVCFRYVPEHLRDEEEHLDALNKQIMEQVQAGGKAFVNGTLLHDRFVLRSCALHYALTKTDVEAIVEEVRQVGERCLV